MPNRYAQPPGPVRLGTGSPLIGHFNRCIDMAVCASPSRLFTLKLVADDSRFPLNAP